MHRFVLYYIMLMSPIVGNTNHSMQTNFELEKNTTSCILCKDIISIVEHELNTANKTVSDIERIIGAVCKMLRLKSQREECEKIDSMIDKIKDMIIGGLDRKEICYKMGFCNK